MSGANASPTGRSHHEMSGANASPTGRSHHVMSNRPVCKSSDHLFVPILEVSVPLLRCIHCNVFAYHDTVKQLAKNRSYRKDDDEVRVPPVASSYWRRFWIELRKRFASAGPSLPGS
jgi:hypothetical protein